MSQLRHLVIPLLASLLSSSLQAQASTVTWTGATNNDWSTASNWDTEVVPTNTDNVIIALDGATVTLPNGVAFTVKSLTLGNGNGGTVTTLVSASGSGTVGFRLTVLDTVYIASDGHLNMQGSPEGTNKFGDSLKVAITVTNGGTITLKHNSHISTTALTNNGTLDCSYAYYSYGLNKVVGNVTNSTTGTIKIEGNQLSRQGYLEVQGNLTNSGLVYLYTTASASGGIFATLDVSGTFTNALTGTFVDSATTWDSIRSLTVGSFDNQGTFISRSDPNTYLFAITADGVAGSFVNGGHMDIKQSMRIYDVGTFVNSGTINIDTTEILYLYGFNNAGVYTGSGEQFHGNGTLSLTDVALNVSTFPALDSLGLTMSGASSLTLTDSLIVYRTLTGGMITANGVRNQGTLTLEGGGSLSSPDKDIINNGTLVLTGGSVTGAVTNNDSLNVGSNATITGAVTNGANAKIIIANAGATAGLSVDGGLTNHGYLELNPVVSGGSYLLKATNGSLTNSATGTIQGATGYSGTGSFGLQTDLVNEGTFESNFRISINGGNHSNSGTFRINQGANASQSQFSFTNGATFTNTDTVFLDTTTYFSISGSTYHGETGTLDGTGRLSISSGTHAYFGEKFVNKDYGVKLSLTRSTIHVDSLINQATWVAYGDTVYADSVIINQGKLTLQPYYSSGYYYNAWYGSFINQDTLIVEPYSSYSANEFLGGPVVNEPGALIYVRSDASKTATLTVDSSLINHGKLELKNADGAPPAANLNVNKGWLTNTGIIDGLVYSTVKADLDNQGIFNVAPNTTFTMNKNPQTILNSGTIHVKAGEYFKVQWLDAFTNTGTVRIDSGTALQLFGPTSTRDGVFDNTVGTLSVAGTLSLSYLIADLAPKVVVSDSMTLSLYRAVVNTDSLINQGYLSVGGDTINGHVVNQDTASFGYWNTVNGSFENQAGAVLQLIGDLNNSSSTLTVDSALTNAGVMKLSTTFYNSRGFVLTISNGAFANTPAGALTVTKGVSTNSYLDFKVDAPEHVNQGILTVDSAAVLTIAGTSFDNESGGVVQGEGTLDVTDVAFTNAGAVNPGGSPGILTFEGDFAQETTGVINIEIKGDNPGTEYDQLNITGEAALAGSLKVTIIDPYSPLDGTTFLPLIYSSSSGVFDTLTTQGGGTFLISHIRDTGVYLTAGSGNSWPFIGRIADITAPEDTTLAIALQTFDPDGDLLTFNASADQLAVQVAVVEDTLQITPELNWNGTANIKVVVADPAGLKDSTEFVLILSPVQDKPLAFNIVAPAKDSTVVIDQNNLNTQFYLQWDQTEDPDGDYVPYYEVVFTDSLDIMPSRSPGRNTAVYWTLADIKTVMENNDYVTMSGTWTIAARDQADTTEATNGPFNLTIDASAILGVDGRGLIPEVFALHQNHPNPFNPSTTLRFDLPEAGDVTILVYDLLGREVVRLVDNYMEPGYQKVIWNGRTASGRDVPSGIYIARMMTPAYTKSIKMALLK